MKIVGEKNEKIFTKNNGKDIIKNNNNLLLTKDSYNRYFGESGGLVMKKTKVIVLNRVLNVLSFKEKILVRMFSKTFSKVYRKGMIECFNYYNK